MAFPFEDEFTPDLRDQIIHKIQDKTGSTKCTICHTGPLIIGDGIISLNLQKKTRGLVLGGPHMPCVALVCSHCGHTHLFNLVTLGIIPGSK